VLGRCNLATVYRALWSGQLVGTRNDSGTYWYIGEEQALAWVSRLVRTWSRAPGYRQPDKRIALGRVRVRLRARIWATLEQEQGAKQGAAIGLVPDRPLPSRT
jgi:hypothetical protein